MERQNSSEKQRPAKSRSNEQTETAIEASRGEASLKLDNPHPDSELSYSQQIKEQDKTVANATSKSLETGEPTVTKSSEPEKSSEIAGCTGRPGREEETSRDQRNLLKKLAATVSASKQPNRLPPFSSLRRRNMARYKRRPGEHKRQLTRARSTTPDSDDELSNNQTDFSTAFKRREAIKQAERNRDPTFKVHGDPSKSRKKRHTDLDDLVQRALIKHNTFNNCNISLHFG